jgi:hypothetical protein
MVYFIVWTLFNRVSAIGFSAEVFYSPRPPSLRWNLSDPVFRDPDSPNLLLLANSDKVRGHYRLKLQE